MNSGPRWLAWSALLLLASCGQDSLEFSVPDSAERFDYEVVLENAPDEGVRDLAEETLDLYLRQEDGTASPAFLRRRADGDLDTLVSIMQSEGYFQAAVSRTVTGDGVDEPLVATLKIEPGRPFVLTTHRFDLTDLTGRPPVLDAAALGSPIGMAADAEEIILAEDAAVAALRRAGYAYAEYVSRDVLGDPDAATATVTTTIRAGRPYRFGDVRYIGLSRVSPDYLTTYVTWDQGEIYSGAELQNFQQRLITTELFNSVTVEPPEDPPAQEFLPITVTVDERLPRTFSAGLRYDTDTGVTVTVGVEHRNLMGRNERGGFDVTLSETESSLATTFTIPQFRRDGQDLTATASYSQVSEEAFEGDILSASVGVDRRINEEMRGGYALLFEQSDVVEDGRNSDINLVGLPLFVTYDNTDDPLDPSEGIRGRLELTPFAGTVNGQEVAFTRVDGRAATYFALDDEAQTVIAARVRLGSISGEGVAQVPVTRRIFAGGGGSVRGFARDSLGPLDSDGDARGGLSVVELGAEVRYRLSDTLGAVAFVEAGNVSDAALPEVAGPYRTAIGGGVRYYSPIGPVRADLAFPISPTSNEDPFQFYLAIGQAF